MAGRPPTFALPTEPLLEQPTSGLSRLAVPPDVLAWLDDLALEPDTSTRARLLFATLRKNLDQPKATEALTGILKEAGLGQTRGVAALAAFLAVRAPGVTVIEAVRRFANVQRMTLRHRHAQENGEELDPVATDLLARVAEIEADLGESASLPAMPGNGGAPLGLPVVWHCRAAFGQIVSDLQKRGTLSPDQILGFLRLARLELLAAEQRTGALAESINPYSTRHVSQVMPLLSASDTEVRDIRAFLDHLEETGRAGVFTEQHATVHEHLEAGEVERLRQRLRDTPSLSPLYQLLHRIDRNPLPGRDLGYFTDALLRVGKALQGRHLRRDGLNVVEAALIALEFVEDAVLSVPVSAQVREGLRAAGGGVELAETGIRLRFDEDAARTLALPYGLPVVGVEGAEAEEESPEESVKDLVLANINRNSILLGLLKNPKIMQTPGIVSMVVLRSRDLGILSYICNTRLMYTGMANRDVPAALLRTPMRIPVKTLRKFINVRYVPKNQLRRMESDRSAIRREVASEIALYLKSLT